MSTQTFRVVVDGKTRGYYCYQNTADVWCGITGATPEGAYARQGTSHTCGGTEYLQREALITNAWGTWREGEPTEEYTLRWCDECEAVVSPPYDDEELRYHDYDCPWKRTGRCSPECYRRECCP